MDWAYGEVCLSWAEGGLLGDDEFLEFTSNPAVAQRQLSAEAAKAAALRASNSAFAGDSSLCLACVLQVHVCVC